MRKKASHIASIMSVISMVMFMVSLPAVVISGVLDDSMLGSILVVIALLSLLMGMTMASLASYLDHEG